MYLNILLIQLRLISFLYFMYLLLFYYFFSFNRQITTCIKTQQIRLALQHTTPLPSSSSSSSSSSLSPKELIQQLAKYEDWRQLSKMTVEDPKQVVDVLVQAGDFVVLRDWAKLHSLPPQIAMVWVYCCS
jgi:hypothetical protein